LQWLTLSVWSRLRFGCAAPDVMAEQRDCPLPDIRDTVSPDVRRFLLPAFVPLPSTLGGLHLAWVILLARPLLYYWPRSQGARSSAEGIFQFQGFLPGKYVLYPLIGGAREYFSEPVICEITHGGMGGVEVKLQPGQATVTLVIDLSQKEGR
jgi:hypothetical protein